MAKRGPKQIPIDWDKFDKLCHLQCTLAEISFFFDCSEDTIERRVKSDKSMKFADYFAKKRQGGRIAIRRKQFQIMDGGSCAMAIWLGKQYLGQSDKIDHDDASDGDNGSDYQPEKS